jgi:hypothetical protein
MVDAMKVAKSDFATFEELVQAIHESTACTGQRFSFGITGGGMMIQFAAADASLIVLFQAQRVSRFSWASQALHRPFLNTPAGTFPFFSPLFSPIGFI